MLPPISRYKTIKTIKNTEQQPISTMLGTRDNQDGDIIMHVRDASSELALA